MARKTKHIIFVTSLLSLLFVSGCEAFRVIALGLSNSQGIELVHVETWSTSDPGAADTNISMVQGYEADGLIRTRAFGWLDRADNVNSAWFNQTRRTRFSDRHTILHDRSEPTLFPLKIAYTNRNDEIMMTAGNSVRRVSDNDRATGQFSRFAPFYTRFQSARYLVWWNLNSQLVIAEAPTTGELNNVRVILDTPSGGSDGAWQPTAVEFDGMLYVLTGFAVPAGENDTGQLRLSRSSNLIDWEHQFVPISVFNPPRPVITTYEGRLFIFFFGTIPQNYLRYISSLNGTAWSIERDLPIPESFDSTGQIGVQGGPGVAPYNDGLAVSWVSDLSSIDTRTHTAIYRSAE